jgi:hypothetical protein
MFHVEYLAAPDKWLPLPTPALATAQDADAVVAGQLALERAFPTLTHYSYRVTPAGEKPACELPASVV